MSRIAAPATPGRSSESATATSRATDAWNASGGTAAISVITTSATSSEYSAGSRIRASAIWKTALRAFATTTATPTKRPGPSRPREGRSTGRTVSTLSLYSRLR